ncbi:MAG: ester cyclase [Eudoraea sp.]|nr:ester cyclase [Eudoraea sp.]
MKNIAILICSLVFFTSCQNGPERYSTTGEEVAMIQQLITDYENGDWDAWSSVYSDTAKVYHNTRTEAVGAAEALERHQQTLSLMKSYEFMDDPIFFEKIVDDDGETWVNFWGYWKGMLAANEESLETAVHLSVQIEDGKIVEEHGFWNTAPLLEAIRRIEAQKEMPADQKLIDQNVDKFINKFHNQGDATVLLEVLAPAYTRYMNGNKVASTADELAEGFKNSYMKGFPDLKITSKERIYSGDRLFIHWTFSGTNTGEFNGSEPTGNSVNISGLSEARFNSDGKMVLEKVYFNELDMMNQLSDGN